MRAQGACSLRAIGAFALEGFVQRGAEHFPEFLFGLAVQRHRLCFHLPALLQGFDSVHSQSRRSAHFACFIDQGLATVHAGFLRRFEAGCCRFENAFPLALHFTKGFLAEVTRIAPTVGELVQGAELGTPVFALGILCGPGLDLVHQRHTLGTLIGRVFFHLLEPSQHGFVGLVASRIKALPQGMVGQATLVNLLPAVAQLAQLVLHFSATHSGGFVGVQQGFGLVDQVGAHLIRQPTLPAFGVAARR